MKCLAAVLPSLLLLLLLALPRNNNAFVLQIAATSRRAESALFAQEQQESSSIPATATRRPLIAGRLTNCATQAQALSVAIGIATGITEETPSDVALFVPFPYLGAVQKAVGDKLIVGAEMITPQEIGNLPPPPPTSFLPGSQSSWAPGAQQVPTEQHTSLLPKLEAMGISWSMAGFAEERSLQEADGISDSSTINAHVLRLIANGKHVVLRVCETMDDFQQDCIGPIFEAQLTRELAGVSADGVKTKVTIVYEPIWAAATVGEDGMDEEQPHESPELAQATLDVCRRVLALLYNPEVANATRILYGGAAIGELSSIDEFMDMPDIDGALVHVPSSVDDFKRMVNFQAPTKPQGGPLKKLWSMVRRGGKS